jgi:ATP-binding cassette, subfamily B, bacterial
MRKALHAYRLLMGFGFQAAPKQAVFQLLSGMFFELQGPFVAYCAKLLIDASFQSNLQLGMTAAAALALSIGLSLVAVFYYVDWLFTVFDRTEALTTKRLMRILAGTQGLAHQEQPDYLDQVQRIREEQGSLAGMINASAGMLRVTVVLIATAVLLARIHPALLLLPVFGVVSFWFGKKSRDLDITAQEKTSEAERLRRHLFEVGTSSAQGKELRMSGLTGLIVEKHHAVSDVVLHERDRASWRGAVLRCADGLISGIVFAGAITLALVMAIRGQATPGDVVLTIGLAALMNNIIFTAIAYGTSLLWVLKVGMRFVWLEEYARSTNRAIANPVQVPDHLNKGIEISDLSFAYPESDHPVLDRLSVRLPAGKVVALVGENGAGKTTLIKLLCGFYLPTYGSVRIDDVDLSSIPPADWHRHLSAAFQDFTRFEFLVRETVGVADIQRMTDPEAVLAALERAGANGLVDSLPRGLETPLGPAWENGVDLSGGQWQKLALGRGLMRTDPLLVFFDEPTAALDAQTEHALFERFAQTAKAGQNRGTVTLLVSHRFSTVRMADLILVLDQGKIRESGSHEELMAAKGLYAELYELQSRAYR